MAVALSPDGRWLAAGRGDTVEVYDVSDGLPDGDGGGFVPAHRLRGHRDVVQSLAWSRDGTRLASGGFRKVLVWDACSFAIAGTWADGLAGRVTALEFTADGSGLVIADSVPAARSALHWWGFDDGELETVATAHDDAVLDIEVSPDGQLVASASADKLVHLWDASGRRLVGTLEGHTGYVRAVAFAPGSDRLATGGDDGAVKVWELATRKQASSFGRGRRATTPVAGIAWMIDPDAARRKADEPDAEKAVEISTDRIVAVYESGAPVVFTGLVDHKGGESSGGADDRRLEAMGDALTGIALDHQTGAFFAGSALGDLIGWGARGKPSLVRSSEPPEVALSGEEANR
jgi:WD40 repeat protein